MHGRDDLSSASGWKSYSVFERLLRPGKYHTIFLIISLGGFIYIRYFNRSRYLSRFSASSRKVLLYIRSSTSKEFVVALSKLFKDMSYSCDIIYTNPTQYELPLFVVCPLYSRYEADINYALEGLEWQTRFVTLLIHIETESSLQISPKEWQHTDKFHSTKFVDIAFTRESMVYKCKMSDAAKKDIQTFIEDFYKKDV